MKTKLLLLPVLCMFFMSVGPKSNAVLDTQSQSLKAIGAYDGNEGYGYNFITTHSDGSETTMTFQKVENAVMAEFDLDAELFLNQKFEITYTVKKVVAKDENGFDDENEIFTITHLKAL